MTQVGRYAQIAKHALNSYQLVQYTSFSPPAAINESTKAPTSAAVTTDVFIGDEEPLDKTRNLLRMGEQTCYLHAACGAELKTRVRVA